MTNKNVCPNCGQLFDTDLDKCPLCGTAPQVVDTTDPVQRKRITEAERKQRRADRKEAEQEARRRRKDEQFMLDADEERQIEEEEARRKEEKRRRKEEKKAARRAAALADEEEEAEASPVAPLPAAPTFTAAPARDGRGPMPPEPEHRDRRRVPRAFLALSTVILLAALLVGGSYLLWKLDLVQIPYYESLAARRDGKTEPSAPPAPEGSSDPAAPVQTTADASRDENRIPCSSLSLSESSLVFKAPGDQTQLEALPTPADTTDERVYTVSDAGVAKVSPVGIVTAVGPGTAVITVRCGDVSAECSVVCDFDSTAVTELPLDVTELVLVKDDMTFFAAGENYVLSVTNVPVGTIVQWKSLDESVCTVDGAGHVVAVGAGTTRVVATVGSLSAECWVRCRFE